jgi:hypothetical protein
MSDKFLPTQTLLYVSFRQILLAVPVHGDIELIEYIIQEGRYLYSAILSTVKFCIKGRVALVEKDLNFIFCATASIVHL